MAELVTIKPRPGSKKFLFRSDMGARNLHVVSEDGGRTQTEKAVGEFKGERFPKSRQMFRIIWSNSKRQWLLDGFEKMTDKKQKELDDLVKKSKIQYPKNHKKSGDYIESADIYDFSDPFFTHKQVRVLAKEGEAILDKNRPLDRILLAGLKKNPMFSIGGDEINPLLSTRVKYIIVDKEIDTKFKKEVRNKKQEAYKLYEGLNAKKKLRIAITLGLIRGEDVDPELVDEVLWNYMENTGTSPEEGLNKQEYFIEMCKMDPAKLNLKYSIEKSKRLGILKKTGGSYMLFGNHIGSSLKQVEEFFNNEENQELLVRMEDAINNR